MKKAAYNQTEREMVGYLLGDMSEGEQEQFAARYFADDALFEQLTGVKEELVDAYVRQQLEPRERELFERNFLSTPEGRQEVTFARALRQTLNELPAPFPALPPASAPVTQPWWSNWHWGLAAATACLLLGFGWQWRENRQLRRELQVLQTRQAEQARLAQTLQDELLKLRAANPPTNPPVPAVAPQPGPRLFGESVVALRLPPPQRGGPSATPAARLNAATQTLALQIVLNYAPAARSCTAVLRTAAGELIARQSRLSARPDPLGGLLSWRIAARRLVPGDYEIKVTGRDLDQAAEVTLTYPFRVARP